MSRTGRPRKINADSFLTIRIDQETRNALVCLASNWETTASDAVRRAVRQCAGWEKQSTEGQ